MLVEPANGGVDPVGNRAPPPRSRRSWARQATPLLVRDQPDPPAALGLVVEPPAILALEVTRTCSVVDCPFVGQRSVPGQPVTIMSTGRSSSSVGISPAVRLAQPAPPAAAAGRGSWEAHQRIGHSTRRLAELPTVLGAASAGTRMIEGGQSGEFGYGLGNRRWGIDGGRPWRTQARRQPPGSSIHARRPPGATGAGPGFPIPESRAQLRGRGPPGRDITTRQRRIRSAVMRLMIAAMVARKVAAMFSPRPEEGVGRGGSSGSPDGVHAWRGLSRRT